MRYGALSRSMLGGYMTKSKLSEARKKARLTQQELADAIGAHWTTISRLETGKLPMNYDWATKISEIVRTPWYELMKGGSDPLTLYVQNLIADFGRNVRGYHQDGGSLVALPPPNAGFWALISDETLFPQFRKGDLLHFTEYPVEEIDKIIGRSVMLISTKVSPFEFFGTLARGIDRDRYCVRNAGVPDSVDLEPEIVALADIVYLQPALPPSFNPKIIPEPWKDGLKDE